MYMMSEDQFESMNKEKKNVENVPMEGGGKTEADDVKIAKLHDTMIRKQDAKQIKSDTLV